MADLLSFFDIPFRTGTIDEIRTLVVAAARAPTTSMLVTPNVDHIVALARHLPLSVRDAYQSADIFLCDSKVIGRLGRFSGMDLNPRTGTDRVADILAEGPRDLAIAVAGPTPDQTEALRRRYPGWRFVHIETPPRLTRGSAEWTASIERAASARWDILLACLSFPKQELFAADLRAVAPRHGGVIMCVGAAVDFLSGTQPRAPQSFQRLGLEWFYRLLTNPRRLWRRYLVEGPKIFALYLRYVARRT